MKEPPPKRLPHWKVVEKIAGNGMMQKLAEESGCVVVGVITEARGKRRGRKKSSKYDWGC